MNLLAEKNIILGVTGGIAAYKAADLASYLTQLGAKVHVILTKSAQEFISPLTFSALTGLPAAGDLFSADYGPLKHIELATAADAFLIAPATANVIGKLAAGLADDLLTTTALAVTCPRLLAPAMNANMYAQQVVQENIALLCRRGWELIAPEAGRMACGAVGLGRLADKDKIVAFLRRSLGRKDLAGLKILVTAGGTREPLDPVRYLGNRSSGRMGYALAQVAWERSGEVILISGPTALVPPYGVRFIPVTTAQEMYEAVMDIFPEADIVVKAAAVADFRPANQAKEKIKKEEHEMLVLNLEPTPDILAALGRKKTRQILAGFAAETQDLLANAKEKLKAKNLDLIVANDVSRRGVGFESDTNIVTLLFADGRQENLPEMDKYDVAHAVWDAICSLPRFASLKK